MRRLVPALVVVLTVVTAGCLGAPGSGTPTKSPAPTDPKTPTSTPEPTDGSPAEPDTASTEYRLEAGELPENVESLTVTVRVVLVERAEDLGACWRETFYGPYKPTPTPIAPPVGDCHRTTPETVTLTEGGDGYRIGPVTADGRFDAGHALIVTDVTATTTDGSELTAIKGVGGHRANVITGPADGPYHVTLGLTDWDSGDASAALVSNLVEESG